VFWVVFDWSAGEEIIGGLGSVYFVPRYWSCSDL